MSGKKARKAKKKAARNAGIPALSGQPQALPAASPVAGGAALSDFSDSEDRLLEVCRTHWQYGEWAELAALGETQIASSRDRAKLALLAAAGRSNTGDMEMARHFTRRAAQWGCDARLISQVLISTVHNSLGRVAACLGDADEAAGHFETAIRLVEPRAATALLGRTRQVRETARLGLLPEAERMLQIDAAKATEAPAEHAARLAIIKTEMDLLHTELSLALQRRQVFPAAGAQALDAPTDDLTSRSVSQLGQDLWVLEQSGYQRGGYFVEFGATDGVLLSNTLLLEREFGWSGLCAEPNPNFFRQLAANRRCTVRPDCIGGATGDKVRFILADAYGGIAEYADSDSHKGKRQAYEDQGEVIELTTISLHDFLTANGAPKVIDYLSIDTEGSEYAILRTFPFDKWRVRFLTVEHNFTPMREAIRDLLEPLGYQRTPAKFDDWYALRT